MDSPVNFDVQGLKSYVKDNNGWITYTGDLNVPVV